MNQTCDLQINASILYINEYPIIPKTGTNVGFGLVIESSFGFDNLRTRFFLLKVANL